jgi:hypothetical protein
MMSYSGHWWEAEWFTLVSLLVRAELVEIPIPNQVLSYLYGIELRYMLKLPE